MSLVLLKVSFFFLLPLFHRSQFWQEGRTDGPKVQRNLCVIDLLSVGLGAAVCPLVQGGPLAPAPGDVG